MTGALLQNAVSHLKCSGKYDRSFVTKCSVTFKMRLEIWHESCWKAEVTWSFCHCVSTITTDECINRRRPNLAGMGKEWSLLVELWHWRRFALSECSYCKFTALSNSERSFKISQHFWKFGTNIEWHIFYGPRCIWHNNTGLLLMFTKSGF